jgi:hypothetical protein
LRKQPALSNDQYLEVQRLHDEGEALFNQAKYLESLELSLKAQSILGIDPSGAAQAPQADSAPRAGAEPTPSRRRVGDTTNPQEMVRSLLARRGG